MKADLHTHSIHSDGSLAPAEVVRRAHAKGVRLLVLSDHDSVSGFPEARDEGRRLGLDVRCGVEINTVSDDLHILGYGIDWEGQSLQASLEEFRGRRRRRIEAIVERLRSAQVDVAWDEIEAAARGRLGQSVGRPHIADVLIRKRIVRSRREAFDRWLSRDKPGFVEPMGPTAQEAISAIRAAGGVPVVAHPGRLFGRTDFSGWAEAGLGGIEVHYPTHTGPTRLELAETAEALGLAATGGSDFHGPGTGRDRIGGFDASGELVARLFS